MKRLIFFLLLIGAISKVNSKQFLSDNDNGTSFFSKESLELLNIVTSEDFFHKVLNKKDGDTFVKCELQSNKKYQRHELFEQYYHGIKVEGCGYVLHFTNDSLVSAHGNYIPIDSLITIPSITESEAIEVFAKYEGIPSSQVSDYRCCLSILPPKDSVNNKLTAKLAYSVSIPFAKEMGLIDAHTGEVLFVCPAMLDFSSTATFSTLYSGTQQSTTHYYGGAYHLVDSTRNAVIHTWDLNSMPHYSYRTELSDNDNIWTYNEHANNYHYIALDVHWGLQKIYDFLYNKYGRNSYDGNGSDINAYINDDFDDDACWNPSYQAICFAKSYNIFNPFVSIDIIAHEFGHGITNATTAWGNSGFLYNLTNNQQKEIAGSKEGLSDIWAIIVESDVKGASGRWQVAEECTKGNTSCLRNIANPSDSTAYTQIADTYNGGLYNTSSDPHVLAGIISRWFYLLVNGGCDTNGLGNFYLFNGIGMDAAESIIVNAIYNGYLYYTKSFSEIRTALKEYALNIGNTYYAQQIENAWYAVGVGSNPNPVTISGPDIPCGTAVYSIENLPNTYTVSWSWSELIDDFFLLQNTPTTNACTIANNNKAYMNGYLTAAIKKNGVTVKTCTKYIHTGADFSGYYTVGSYFYPGWYYSGESYHPFASGETIHTYKGPTITLNSSDFIGANITYSGTTPLDWTNSNGVITFHFKYLPPINPLDPPNNRAQSIGGDAVLVITGTYPNNCKTFRFTVIGSEPLDPISPMSSNGNTDSGNCQLSVQNTGSFYTFSIVADNSEVTGEVSESDNGRSGNEDYIPWHLTITHSITGNIVYSNDIRDSSVRIDTSDWTPGIYVVQAKVGTEVLTQKISITR